MIKESASEPQTYLENREAGQAGDGEPSRRTNRHKQPKNQSTKKQQKQKKKQKEKQYNKGHPTTRNSINPHGRRTRLPDPGPGKKPHNLSATALRDSLRLGKRPWTLTTGHLTPPATTITRKHQKRNSADQVDNKPTFTPSRSKLLHRQISPS